MHDPGGSASLVEVPRRSTAGAQTPTMLLYLSLFLLLLVFFAVLGSLTRLEAVRAADALGSLESAFLGTNTGRARGPTLMPAADGLEKEIGELVESELPIATVKSDHAGNELRLSVNAGEMFQLRRAELRSDRSRLLDAIARILLERGANGTREISLGVNAPQLAVEPRTLAALRAGALARAMIARGVPAGQVSAAIIEGPTGLVSFSFRVRPETAP
jgi:hypothetical protein